MSTFNLVSRLSAVLKNDINEHALNLSSRCAGRFRLFINMGVERMAAINMTQNQVLVYLAENNIKHLVEHLSKKARGKGTYPNIGDNTLETAIEECNPLWPYK
jgi:hypothetical protein